MRLRLTERLRQGLWFIGLWVLGVGLLGGVAFMLRGVLKLAGG